MKPMSNLILSSTLATAFLLTGNVNAQDAEKEPENAPVESKAPEVVSEEKVDAEVKTSPESKLERSPSEVVAIPPKKLEIEPLKKKIDVADKPQMKVEVVNEDTIIYSPNAEVRLRQNIRVLGNTSHDLTSRARVGLKGKYKALSLNVQVQDARLLGFSGVSDGGITGIHEGYLQLDNETFMFRAGRQEINLGGQRMIGSLNWADSARAFDSLRLQVKMNNFKVDLFGAVLSPQDSGVDTNSTPFDSHGDYLGGAYFTYTPMKTIAIEPYILFRHHGPNSRNVKNKHNIASFGLRSWGDFDGGLGYEVEGDLQVGKRNGNDHLAYAFAGHVYYVIDNPMKPKIEIGGSFATGESSDGKTNEFDNFFPTNHKFYGSADLFGWRNIIQGDLSVAAHPSKTIDAKLMVAPTLLADKDGRWSNAGGKTIGAPSGEDVFLGTEIDFSAKWKPEKHFFFSGGYSLFLPGKAAEERLGSDDAIHYLYLMSGVKFN